MWASAAECRVTSCALANKPLDPTAEAAAGQRQRSADDAHHRPLAAAGKEVSWTRTWKR